MRLKSNAGVQQNRMIGLRPIDSNGLKPIGWVFMEMGTKGKTHKSLQDYINQPNAFLVSTHRIAIAFE